MIEFALKKEIPKAEKESLLLNALKIAWSTFDLTVN